VKGKGFKDYIYTDLKLPVQHHPVTKSITTNYAALLRLKKKTKHPVIEKALPLTELYTRMSQLQMETDSDGRVRSTYNLVGSETGRVTCKKSPTGTGRNLQATADEDSLKDDDDILHEGLRDILVADPGYYMAKADLKGADGWTVGANMASLGDYSMLHDLQAGVKPASLLTLMRRHGHSYIAGKDRPALKELCKEVGHDDWDYFSSKQLVWGFCYMLGVKKASDLVFEKSAGQVEMTEKEVEDMKRLFFSRYNVPIWWRAMERKLFSQPYPPKLTSPSGHTRMFFGRRQEILGEALAHEPQSVTTYATNKAVYNCWRDEENRIHSVSFNHGRTMGGMPTNDEALREEQLRCTLRVEPLHQVHDEFLTQFKIEDTEWAIGKIKQWFNNEIIIAGIKITIPFDGAYGKNWSMNDEAKVGSI
jgi:hypothetical protein